MSTPDIVERLTERRKIRYMANCKCGHCQLIHEDDLDAAIAELVRLRASRDAMVEECAKVVETLGTFTADFGEPGEGKMFSGTCTWSTTPPREGFAAAIRALKEAKP